MLLAFVLSVEPAEADPATPPDIRELLPGVRVGEGFVEFRGTVCADLSHPQTPVVYLELLVTGPDSREHESLVVSGVKPSNLHAGLLAAGLEPGRPVAWRGAKVAHSAEGERVRVEAAMLDDDGEPGAFVDLASWAINKETERRLTEAEGWGLVFAGSMLDEQQGYAADMTGTIIGLTDFGTEVIAAAWDLSPHSAIDEPVWIVDKDRVPAFGTPVVVRITRLETEPKDAKPGEETDEPS
ncbi:MAG: YdjY domain-containing protein [Phycisphaerales bacterium]|nr:hypothetical protein [Planctomycetota bacterium]MCH8507930.1 YdjY domain-containing protein [Phycisphaerales bacterium]